MPSGPVRNPEIGRPGRKGSLASGGPVERLEPVARRVLEQDEVGDVALVGQAAGRAADLGSMRIEPRRQRVEGGRVRRLPTEEGEALALVAGHDQALLAVVHAKGPHRAAAVDLLHAEQTGGVRAPVVEPRRTDPDIAECDEFRGRLHEISFWVASGEWLAVASRYWLFAVRS